MVPLAVVPVAAPQPHGVLVERREKFQRIGAVLALHDLHGHQLLLLGFLVLLHAEQGVG